VSASKPETGQPPQSYGTPQPRYGPPGPSGGTPHQSQRPQNHGPANTGRIVTRWLPVSLIAIGAILFLGALATLTQKWAWSWHNGSGQTFTLAHMHGVCTSTIGELAQGVSGSVASNCTRIDSTWTAAVVGIVVGVIVAAAGVVRMWRTTRKPQYSGPAPRP
jgi:hypothetical protein